jgi:beta-glucosidase
MDGEEVVQLYVGANENDHNLVRSLKGFQRIFLKKGETKTIIFDVPYSALSVMDESGKEKALKGKVTISIGGSQPRNGSNNQIKTLETTLNL